MRVPEAVLGVLLVAGSALGGLVWYRSATDPQTVVVAAGDLPRGHVVTASDLRAARVTGAEGLTLVSAEAAGSLIGRTLEVDLAAGAPLSPSVLGDAEPLGSGEALVAAAIGPGEYPPLLAAGDLVRVVVIGDTAGDLAVSSGGVDHTLADEVAEVSDLQAPTDVDPNAVITLRVSLELAARIAGAASVRLIQVEG